MMSVTTGKSIDLHSHIKQSIQDILTTPIGSRLMRRGYGSELFELIDQPQNSATRLRLMAATVTALTIWEPRITISAVNITVTKPSGELVIELITAENENYKVNYGRPH